VLTPHPGEAARLLGCGIAEVEQDRFAAVAELQRRFGGVVVLKGAGTHRRRAADSARPPFAATVTRPWPAPAWEMRSPGIIAALLAQRLRRVRAGGSGRRRRRLPACGGRRPGRRGLGSRPARRRSGGGPAAAVR
jgi:hypothetical protein